MKAHYTLLLSLAVLACKDAPEPIDSTPEVIVDEDGDGVPAEEDCDDNNAAVFPEAQELCDGVDNNCDGTTDEDSAADAPTWYSDTDGDGVGVDTLTQTACSAPDTFAAQSGDCDDGDAAIHPGADEPDCTDPTDYNCDGSVGYADADADGVPACEDCDDTDATVNPSAQEVCDERDNNCDGTTDQGAVDALTWYADTDGDTYGDPSSSTVACAAPEQSSTNSLDCDDTDASVSPAATELCDGQDNNCDGTTDEDSAADAPTWYADADSDGYGDPSLSSSSCAQPGGSTSQAGDCDDSRGAVNPGATELCDTLDNNCDGDTDEDSAADAPTWYADADSDGYGDPDRSTRSCAQPGGYLSGAGDCDDTLGAVNPGATEVCDTLDNNCDGDTDEDSAADAPTWYADADGDGYGDPDVPVVACTAPSGYVADSQDCDDSDSAVYESCFPVFTGATGGSWTTLTSTTSNLYSLQTYQMAGEPYIYNFYPTAQRYSVSAGTWTNLSSTVPDTTSCIWCSAAPYGGYLYLIRFGDVSRYDPSADTWTSLATFTGSDDYNMTESDEYGVIYGHTASGQIVAYDTATGSITYTTTGLGSEYETRMAYDPGTRSIYFGAYNAKALYRYEIDTGTISTMTSHPESQLNDIFCGDRSGHIYAAGATSGTTMYQYDIATDTWAAIPSLPTDHGNNGSCTVSGDGYLYVGTGSNKTFYRLDLY